MFKYTEVEVQSGVDRIAHAEGLIKKLPCTHDVEISRMIKTPADMAE